jgi:GTP-binding protein
MKIKSAEFIKSAVLLKDCPKDPLPEIALIGKSNVGKSSLINRFINRKGLAKTSNTPGKTRTLNFYLINNDFYFVDLPGYGFAKAPASERKGWKQMIEDYLTTRETLAGGIFILDVRRDPGAAEAEIYEWFAECDIPVITVLNKADKFSKNKLIQRVKLIKKALPIKDPITFSATSGVGKAELSTRVAELLKGSNE